MQTLADFTIAGCSVVIDDNLKENEWYVHPRHPLTQRSNMEATERCMIHIYHCLDCGNNYRKQPNGKPATCDTLHTGCCHNGEKVIPDDLMDQLGRELSVLYKDD